MIETAPANVAHALLGRTRASVPDLFEARCAATPDAPFLRSGERCWSYLETRRCVLAAAAELQREAGDGGRIVACLPNGPQAVIAWLAALHTNATYIPIDAGLRGLQLERTLARARPDVLLRDVDIDVDADGHAVPAAPAPTDVEILFTSGSSGPPKAVLLPQNALVRGAGWTAWAAGLGPDDVLHAWMPLNHVAGQVDLVLAAMAAGSCAALYERFSTSRFWQEVGESGATVFAGFPNVLAWILDRTEPPADHRLRIGMIGGAEPALVERGERSLGIRVVDLYGMTELEPIAATPAGRRSRSGACGPPLPDVEVAILDEHDVPVDAGASGEIAVRPRVPDIVLAGYEDAAPATLDRMRNLWWHTGDRGHLDEEGWLHVEGRVAESARRGGEFVSLHDVAAVVSRHRDVVECIAVAVPDPDLGQEIKVVAVRSDPGLSPRELHRWAAGHLSRAMTPRYVEFADELPRDGLGKVRVRQLDAASSGVWDARSGGSDGQ